MKKAILIFSFIPFFSFCQTTPTFKKIVAASSMALTTTVSVTDTLILKQGGVYKFITKNNLGTVGVTGLTGLTGPTGTFSGEAWETTGNTGTNSAVNYIGTTDFQDFIIRTFGQEIMRFSATQNAVGIGTNIPQEMFHVEKNQDDGSRIMISNNNSGTSATSSFIAESGSASTLLGTTSG